MKLFMSVFCVFFGYCVAETAKESQKCSIYDSDCQKTFFQYVGVTYAPTGIAPIGVPVIDPLQLQPTTVNLLGLWNLTFIDGQCEGIAKCIVLSYKTDMKERYKTPDIVCDSIVVRGRYKLVPAPIVKETCSYDFSAEGNITITFDKWYFKVKYPFKIVRHEDNQVYVEAIFDQAEYNSDVDNVTVEATGIKFGDRDFSEHANRWINKNSKLIMGSDIGKRIHELGAKYYYDTYNLFFTRTPASHYYSDNFDNLVEN